MKRNTIRRGLIVTLTIWLSTLTAGCEMVMKPAQPTPGQAPQVIVANETAAMARLRSIISAETAYAAMSGGQYATLDQLIEQGMLNNPSRGKLTGYKLEVRTTPGGFTATATPEKFGITGRRSFYVDETRLLRGAEKGGSEATASDPEI